MELSSALDEVVATTSALRLMDMALLLRDDPRLAFDYLRCLSVVDYGETMQVVYHLWSMEHRHKMALKIDTPAEDARVPSLVSVWAGADWFEREGRDLFGVDVRGAPGPEAAAAVGGVRGVSGSEVVSAAGVQGVLVQVSCYSVPGWVPAARPHPPGYGGLSLGERRGGGVPTVRPWLGPPARPRRFFWGAAPPRPPLGAQRGLVLRRVVEVCGRAPSPAAGTAASPSGRGGCGSPAAPLGSCLRRNDEGVWGPACAGAWFDRLTTNGSSAAHRERTLRGAGVRRAHHGLTLRGPQGERRKTGGAPRSRFLPAQERRGL